MKIKVIVASTRKGGIGKDGDLAWKNELSIDKQKFAAQTKKTIDPKKQNAVIMGRKTWDSLPKPYKPLPKRYNVVISRTMKSTDEVHVCTSLQEAIEHIQTKQDTIEDIYVIGGAELYKEALYSPQLDEIYLTEVLQPFECDTFIPIISTLVETLHLELIKEEPVIMNNNIPIQFLVYKKLKKEEIKEVKELKQESEHPEYQYLNLVRKVLEQGNSKGDRTGTGTISIFGAQMRFNLRNNEFPLLTTKRVFWRGVVEELLWLIKGCTDSKLLAKKGVHIWDDNGSRQFLDKLGFKDREEGDLGPGK